MKTFRNVAGLLLLVLFMTVSFTSCSDDDNSEVVDTLVGTWIEKDTTAPFKLVLNADHTGIISYDTASRALLTDNFNWSTTTSGANSYLNVIHTSGDVIFTSVQNLYVLAGNELIVVFQFGSTSTSYTAYFTRQ